MDKQLELDNDDAINELSEQKQPFLDRLFNQQIEPVKNREVLKSDIVCPNSVIAQISSFNQDGYAVVTFLLDNKLYEHKAETTVKLKVEQVGQKCVLNFNQGDLNKPIIIGIIQSPLSFDETLGESKPLILHSEAGIVLKCGSSRIELNNEGTINIQGMHINSQAYGPNRIKGGSVKIN
jgi:hypothetical protein